MRRFHLSNLSRVAISLLTMAGFIIIFFLTWPILGEEATLLSFFPVVVSSILFGLWGGLPTSLLTILIDIILYNISGGKDWSSLMLHGGLAGVTALLVGGVVVGHLRDISENLKKELAQRQLTAVALQQSQERLQLYFEKATDLIFILDTSGKITQVNQAVVDVLGYSVNELLNKSPLDLVAEENRIEILLSLNKMLSGEPVHRVEIEVYGKDGRRITLEIRGFTVYEDGKIKGTFNIGRDITERRQMENSLRGSERTAQRQAKELSLLEQVRTALAREVALSVIFHNLVNAISKTFGYQQVSIYLLQDNALMLQDQVGYDQVIECIPISKGISGRVASTGEPILLEDVSSDPCFLGAIEGVSSEVCVPLFEKGKVVGVLNVESTGEIRLGEADLKLMVDLSEHIGIALERARLYEEIRESEERIRNLFEAEREQRELAEALCDTAGLLNSTLDFNKVLKQILTNLSRVVEYDAVNIMLIEDGIARIVDCQGYAERGLEEMILSMRLPVKETPNLRNMIETGKPLAIQNTQSYSGWQDFPETRWVLSYAGAPIRIKGRTVGFINVDSSKPNFFTPARAERLQAFADQAAVAIENSRLFGNVQHHARNLALLNDITHTAIRAPSAKDMLQRLANRLCELIDADNVIITLWDEDNQQPTYAAGFGSKRDFYQKLEFLPGEVTMTSSVLQAGRTLIAEDISSTPYLSPRIAAMIPDRAMLGLPLIADNRKLGAALICFNQSHHFTDEEVLLSEQAAGQIALALAKVQLLESEQARAAQLSHANSLVLALGHVATEIEKAPNPDAVMRTLGSELENLGLHCMVSLKEPGLHGSVLHYISLEPEVVAKAEKVSGKGLADYHTMLDQIPAYQEQITQHQPVFIENPTKMLDLLQPAFTPLRLKRLSPFIKVSYDTKLIFLPLIAEEKVIGILRIWGNNLEGNDLPAASLFASQVAVALEAAHLYTKVQQLAITDDLTGILNRRALFETGSKEVERALRFNRPLSALMIDLDHFKNVNDQYGHRIGDQALQKFAETCTAHIRDIDIFGRYGGEEFLLLLPEIDIENAKIVAERLRNIVERTPLPTNCGEVHITISIGVTAANRETKNLDQLIESADQAVYTAKRSGRNRIIAR